MRPQNFNQQINIYTETVILARRFLSKNIATFALTYLNEHLSM